MLLSALEGRTLGFDIQAGRVVSVPAIKDWLCSNYKENKRNSKQSIIPREKTMVEMKWGLLSNYVYSELKVKYFVFGEA